jgi:predicted Zn-dependent protease
MHYLEARLWQELDRPEESAAAFVRHDLVSRLLGLGGRVEPGAVEKLRLLARLDHRAPAVDAWKIELLSEVGRRAEAIEEIERMVDADGVDQEPLLRVELVAERHERWGLAHRLLDRLESLSGADHQLRYRRARLRYLEGDYAGALETVREVLEDEPWLARFIDLLGRVEEAAGDETAAAVGFERALDLAPWRVETRLALADLELRRGRKDLAQRLLDDAPESSPALADYRRRHGLG